MKGAAPKSADASPPSKTGRAISAETRKERNRLSAKQSRDARAAYMCELEDHLRQAQERAIILEQELEATSKKLAALQQEAANNPMMFFLNDMV